MVMSVEIDSSEGELRISLPPKRVVSLVPSLTESLFDLGLGEFVVGITDFCVHPADGVKFLTRIGGPKNPELQKILSLNPDLVLANQEENPRKIVENLRERGIPVLVTFPQSVRQALEVLLRIAGMFSRQTAFMRIKTLEMTYSWLQSRVDADEPMRYFCPIWMGEIQDGTRWWMTFNQHTYVHDLLRILGGKNIFAERERRYPLMADLGLRDPIDSDWRDTRYPRVVLDEVRRLDPEIILLPNEPYPFDESHSDDFKDLFQGTSAVSKGRIVMVDGSLITWHGTRMGKAFQQLPNLFNYRQ